MLAAEAGKRAWHARFLCLQMLTIVGNSGVAVLHRPATAAASQHYIIATPPQAQRLQGAPTLRSAVTMSAAAAPDRSRRASKAAPSARFAVAGTSANRSAASLYACERGVSLGGGNRRAWSEHSATAAATHVHVLGSGEVEIHRGRS